MASAFGHFASAWAISNIFKIKEPLSKWTILVGMFCAAAPDLDFIGYKLGIPYLSMWGHRGITHSFLFAFLLALVFSLLLAKSKRLKVIIFIYLFLCTALHGILDAMTTGGYGIAFFAPFDNTRYFLPWQFIQVSPLSIESFMGERGLKVIISEWFWIGLPTMASYLFYRIVRSFFKSNKKMTVN